MRHPRKLFAFTRVQKSQDPHPIMLIHIHSFAMQSIQNHLGFIKDAEELVKAD